MEGDEVWLRHNSPDLSVEPPFYQRSILEASGLFATIPGPNAQVCFIVKGSYVEFYKIHFWAAEVSEVIVELFKNDIAIPEEVRIHRLCQKKYAMVATILCYDVILNVATDLLDGYL